MMTNRLSQYVFLDRYTPVTGNLHHGRTWNEDIGCKFHELAKLA